MSSAAVGDSIIAWTRADMSAIEALSPRDRGLALFDCLRVFNFMSHWGAARYAKTSAFREVTERGLAVLADAAPERTARLANVAELYRFLEAELPALWTRWEQHQAALAQDERPA